jgi:hypothetical protein
MTQQPVPVAEPPIEFYLNLRENGTVRCGLKGPFNIYDYTDVRGDGQGVRAWVEIVLPYAVWADPRAIAARLSDAAMAAWNCANTEPYHTQIEVEVHVLGCDGEIHPVQVRAGGNFGHAYPHEHLLHVLDRVQTSADAYVALIQQHGRKFPLN